MDPKRTKLIYYVSTGLISALMLFSASMYFIKHEMVAETFTNLGFPTFIIYPLAIAKLLGLIAIWTRRSETLKEWAYAGFFFDFMLAGAAHYFAGDGQYGTPLVAIALLLVSYNAQKKMGQPKSQN